MGFAHTLTSLRLMHSKLVHITWEAISPAFALVQLASIDSMDSIKAAAVQSRVGTDASHAAFPSSNANVLFFARASRASKSSSNPVGNTSSRHTERMRSPRATRGRKNASGNFNASASTQALQLDLPLDSATDNTVKSESSSPNFQNSKPSLRVIQLRPKEQPARLIISGRMAEVCAALERLAANEMASNQCA